MEKIFNFIKTILGFAKETTSEVKHINTEILDIVETFVKVEEPTKVEEVKPVIINEVKPKTTPKKKKKPSTKK